MEAGLIFLFYSAIPLSFSLGTWLSREKIIGEFWGAFFVFTLTPLIGFPIILLSKKTKGEIVYNYNNPSSLKIVLACFLIISAILPVIMIWIMIERYYNDSYAFDYHIDYNALYRMICIMAGLIGAGIYLIIDRRISSSINEKKITKESIPKYDKNELSQIEEECPAIKKQRLPFYKKRRWQIIGVILFFLILSNPGTRRFREFLGDTNDSGNRRLQNWGVLSIYESGSDIYLAIALNFFKINI